MISERAHTSCLRHLKLKLESSSAVIKCFRSHSSHSHSRFNPLHTILTRLIDCHVLQDNEEYKLHRIPWVVESRLRVSYVSMPEELVADLVWWCRTSERLFNGTASKLNHLTLFSTWQDRLDSERQHWKKPWIANELWRRHLNIKLINRPADQSPLSPRLEQLHSILIFCLWRTNLKFSIPSVALYCLRSWELQSRRPMPPIWTESGQFNIRKPSHNRRPKHSQHKSNQKKTWK